MSTDRPETLRPDVAIIGMACRVPGADGLDAFFDNLVRGVESITHFSREQLLAAGTPVEVLSDPAFVGAAGVVSHHDCFDADFFGVSPREAALTDPQQRVFLEVAWTALEHAGYDASRYRGLIGVYGGV